MIEELLELYVLATSGRGEKLNMRNHSSPKFVKGK